MKFDRDGDEIVLCNAVRTPVGQAGKSLSKYESHELGAMAVEELFKKYNTSKDIIDSVVVGEIGQSSKAPNAARVIAVKTELPLEAPAMTVANNCVSGFEAIFTAARQVMVGENETVLVVGEESMSNMPIYIKGAQHNPKTATVAKLEKNWADVPAMEDVTLVDGVEEGLTDPIRLANMAETGEVVAQKLGLDKKALDDYAYNSYRKTLEAIQAGKYKPWLMNVPTPKGELTDDEYIMTKTGFVEKPERFEKATAIFDAPPHTSIKGFYEKYGEWVGKPFQEGTSQAAVSFFNACPRSDGAGALIVTTRSNAEKNGLKIQGVLKGWGHHGVDPIIMGLGMAYAMNDALKKSGLQWADMSFFEVHEAFAATALGTLHVVKDELGYDLLERYNKGDVNRNGGTLAIGHPLGMTGIRVAINQMLELENDASAKYSMAAICAGGGVGGAMILGKA